MHMNWNEQTFLMNYPITGFTLAFIVQAYVENAKNCIMNLTFEDNSSNMQMFYRFWES